MCQTKKKKDDLFLFHLTPNPHLGHLSIQLRLHHVQHSEAVLQLHLTGELHPALVDIGHHLGEAGEVNDIFWSKINSEFGL